MSPLGDLARRCAPVRAANQIWDVPFRGLVVRATSFSSRGDLVIADRHARQSSSHSFPDLRVQRAPRSGTLPTRAPCR